VLRIGNTLRWDDLRFDALIAHDHRVAAELLLLFVEDLAELGLAASLTPPSTAWHEPRHDRLTVGHKERSETLMDFRLTDRPAVVIAVEGETELLLFPRVLKMYGVDEESDLVQLVNRKGVYSDTKLLARSVAVPRLDPAGYYGARLRSPITALVVPVDPEGDSSTPVKRETQRHAMVNEVLESLPADARTPEVRADLEHIIRISCWGEEAFEFAHFTDYQLAQAIRRVAGVHAPSVATISDSVGRCRRGRANLATVEELAGEGLEEVPRRRAVAGAREPDRFSTPQTIDADRKSRGRDHPARLRSPRRKRIGPPSG
jgi:hypothetical protein